MHRNSPTSFAQYAPSAGSLSASATISLVSAIVATTFGIIVFVTNPSKTETHTVLDFTNPPGTVEDGRAVVYNSDGLVRATQLELAGTLLTTTADELNSLLDCCDDGNSASFHQYFEGASANTPQIDKGVIYGSRTCEENINCTEVTPVVHVGSGLVVKDTFLSYEQLSRIAVTDPAVPEAGKTCVYVANSTAAVHLPLADGLQLTDGTIISAGQLGSLDTNDTLRAGTVALYGDGLDITAQSVKFLDTEDNQVIELTTDLVKRLIAVGGDTVSYVDNSTIHVRSGGLKIGDTGRILSEKVLKTLAIEHNSETSETTPLEDGQFVRFGLGGSLSISYVADPNPVTASADVTKPSVSIQGGEGLIVFTPSGDTLLQADSSSERITIHGEELSADALSLNALTGFNGTLVTPQNIHSWTAVVRERRINNPEMIRIDVPHSSFPSIVWVDCLHPDDTTDTGNKYLITLYAPSEHVDVMVDEKRAFNLVVRNVPENGALVSQDLPSNIQSSNSALSLGVFWTAKEALNANSVYDYDDLVTKVSSEISGEHTGVLIQCMVRSVNVQVSEDSTQPDIVNMWLCGNPRSITDSYVTQTEDSRVVVREVKVTDAVSVGDATRLATHGFEIVTMASNDAIASTLPLPLTPIVHVKKTTSPGPFLVLPDPRLVSSKGVSIKIYTTGPHGLHLRGHNVTAHGEAFPINGGKKKAINIPAGSFAYTCAYLGDDGFGWDCSPDQTTFVVPIEADTADIPAGIRQVIVNGNKGVHLPHDRAGAIMTIVNCDTSGEAEIVWDDAMSYPVNTAVHCYLMQSGTDWTCSE